MNEFDDLTDLDDVLGPLRNSAQPAELVGESATVDLMVKAHRTPEERHMFRSRSARIATLVAAGVLGFGGMAAAASDDQAFDELLTTLESESDPDPDPESESDPDPESDPQIEPEPETQSEPETQTESEPEPEIETQIETHSDISTIEDVAVDEAPLEDPDPDTEFNESYCEPGNHGKTVSAVARGVFDPEVEYPGDVTVKMAAQSSCGKLDKGEPKSEAPSADESSVEEIEVEESEKSEMKSEVKAERPGKGADGPGNGKSNGKSNGNGNGNGNGKRGG